MARSAVAWVERARPTQVFDRATLRRAIELRRNAGLIRRLKKPPRVLPPKRLEAEYFLAITKTLGGLSGLVARELAPEISSIVAQAPRELRADARFDDFDSELERALARLRVQFLGRARADVRGSARAIGEAVSLHQDRDHKRTFEVVLGVRPDLAEPWLGSVIDNFTRTNVRLIEDVSESVLDTIERRVGDGVRSGLTASTIAEQIIRDAAIDGNAVTRSKASFIARDQVSSLYGDLARVRQTKLGIPGYFWRSTGDERVRDSHIERNGERFTWSAIEPQLEAKGLTVDKIDGHPGRPPACRCIPEPDIEGMFEAEIEAEPEPSEEEDDEA